MPKGGGNKYQMTTKNGTTIYLQAVTMIDPAPVWIEIRTLPCSRVNLVLNQVELAWLTRYPPPSKNILDCGNEFLVEFKIMSQADYGIAVKPITPTNPQAYSILERAYQTLIVQNRVLDDENTWDGILASTLALRATVHTTTQLNRA